VSVNACDEYILPNDNRLIMNSQVNKNYLLAHAQTTSGVDKILRNDDAEGLKLQEYRTCTYNATDPLRKLRPQ
jgi:hypothetical protein